MVYQPSFAIPDKLNSLVTKVRDLLRQFGTKVTEVEVHKLSLIVSIYNCCEVICLECRMDQNFLDQVLVEQLFFSVF